MFANTDKNIGPHTDANTDTTTDTNEDTNTDTNGEVWVRAQVHTCRLWLSQPSPLLTSYEVWIMHSFIH